MMLKSLRLFFCLALLWPLQSLSAQCSYTLEMLDLGGNGWDIGSLTVNSGGDIYEFYLNQFNDDGIDSTVTFPVTAGETITLNWTPSFFNNEIVFSLFDVNGIEIFSAANPLEGQIFATVAACPTCIAPSNFALENVWDNRARLRWTPKPGVPAFSWLLIYGPQGFTPGPGAGDTLTSGLPKATITGLQKKTKYDCYLVQRCDGTDYSVRIGPVSFETYFTDDVGISGVVTPQNDCNLGVEIITVALRNYGSNPQSLIPFNYSVNGDLAGIGQPEDGFYTGVLGKDSTENVEFELTYDFSEPGEYEIRTWTEFDIDEDRSNDTTIFYLNNILQLPYSQDFERWDGGWTVSDSSLFSSWEYGSPAAALGVTPTSGTKGWFTNLDGIYNANEFSYLESPCFDLSNINEDPVIEFNLNLKTEFQYDGLYLEVSYNGGESWERVGDVGDNLNWYNEESIFVPELGPSWMGENTQWIKARHRIDGAAGESRMNVRFAFSADVTQQRDGIGLDDIQIYVPLDKDFAGLSITTAGENTLCGLAADSVRFTFSNFGKQTQSNYQLAYSVNGGPAVVETPASLTLASDAIATYTFKTTFDSRDVVSNIRCWTLLPGEEVLPNDEAPTYSVDHRPEQVPFQYNFEDGEVPAGWGITPASAFVTDEHNNVSNVLAVNLFSSTTKFEYLLPRFGVLGANDSISFDYRITNWDIDPDLNGLVPTIIGLSTNFQLEVSEDCGATYKNLYTINTLNHLPLPIMRTIRVSLAQYAGKSVLFRFRGNWGAGDFWFDLDNINLLSCPANMQLTAQIQDSGLNLSNGSATVNVGLGNPPYTYKWSTGATTQTATNLPPGNVSVSVTDAFGCTDVLTVTVGVLATNNIEGLNTFTLQPNPTSGLLNLTVGFEQAFETNIQVLDAYGRLLHESNKAAADTIQEQIDLEQYPAGMYFVRLRANGQSAAKRVVKF